MADVTKITLPDGTTKDIKDATARTQANWNTNNGVKNLAPYNNGTENSPLKIPCNFKNGESYTVSWSSITSTSTSDSSRIAFMSGDNIVSNIYYASHSVAGSATLTLTADCDSLWVYAGSIYEANKTVTISNFMVRPTSIVDSTYEPYALPNTKITPELIDLVDSGAKNVFSPTITTGVDSDTNLTLTVNSDNTITISGTAQSSKYIVIGRGYTTAGNYVLSGTPSGITVNTGGYMRIEQGGEGVSQVLTPVDITLDNREYVVYLRVLSGKTYNHTITPMLCTKAAWDVSQKFVPYRPTYEDTVEQVATNKNNISINSIKSSITMEQGYTLVTQSTLYQQGKHIFGNLIIKKDSGNFSDTSETVFTLGNPPAITGMLFCGFGANEWGIESIGYAFLGSNGAVSVKDTKTTNTTVNIAVDYVIS